MRPFLLPVKKFRKIKNVRLESLQTALSVVASGLKEPLAQLKNRTQIKKAPQQRQLFEALKTPIQT